MTKWEVLQKGNKDIEDSPLPDDKKMAMKIELLREITISNTLDRIDDRRATVTIVGQYGVTFLDDYLRGIMPDDFILIGSDSGSGKSTLAYDIAFLNSKTRPVSLIALECDDDEPYMRLQHKLVSERYYKKYHRNLSYADYYIGNENIRKEIAEFIPDVRMEMMQYKNLTIHYRQKGFGIKELTEKVEEISGRSELLIVDHVDYFDLNISENENAQVSNIMKILRSINLEHHIPVIVISHLRKKSNRRQIVPHIDDFMGTSNKAKQVKTVILLSRNYEADDYEKYTYGTFCHIAKCRFIPSVNLVGMLTYDGINKRYEDKYQLGRIKDYGEKVEPEKDEKYPPWVPIEHIKVKPTDDRDIERDKIIKPTQWGKPYAD